MTNQKDVINDRKLEHINIVLNEEVEPVESRFKDIKLPFKALPEVDYAKIDTSVEFWGKKISFPFLISSMTGGPGRAGVINKNLAIAAEECNVPLALGSTRVILRKPESVESFDVRKLCPSVPLFINIGVVQLNYGVTADDINKIVDMLDADGVYFHINPLQEMIQPEGDTNWEGLIEKIAKTIPKIEKPVIFKEVGTGIDIETAVALKQAGAEWVDVAGQGGTSWVAVEAYRRDDDNGFVFQGEGVDTIKSLVDIKSHESTQDLKVVASGGLRSGLDVAKSIYIGADMAATAKPLLEPALDSPESCIKLINSWRDQYRIALFMTGCNSTQDLQQLGRS